MTAEPEVLHSAIAAIARHLPNGLRYTRRPPVASRDAPLLCRDCRTPLDPVLAGLGLHLFCADPDQA